MRTALLIFILFAACAIGPALAGDYRGNKALKKPVPMERVQFNPIQVEAVRATDLPVHFDWGAVADGPGGEPTSLLQPSW